MTRSWFYRQLGRLPARGWRPQLTGGGQIRLAPPTQMDPTVAPYCPVEAVYLDRSGKSLDYLNASDELELDTEFFNAAVDAADHPPDRLDPSATPGVLQVRAAMLRRLGLEEED